jgi:hypothetical protein
MPPLFCVAIVIGGSVDARCGGGGGEGGGGDGGGDGGGVSIVGGCGGVCLIVSVDNEWWC